jgi:EAL domain-containing protein (putative c-di-GMP-specific phosphodiesterase class I)
VSVNVSPRQFQSPEIFDLVRRRLAESGLPADRLVLEITENLLLADDARVTRGLARLRRLGVRIAIDDFGTGYSGLGYLQRVPLDVVKLDRLFTAGMAVSTQQCDLVAGIVHLAGTLQLEVIAEGVETEEERRLVRQAGCAYGQGFVFARPMPPDAALDWARRYGRVPARAAGSD